jgi:hypothetical protein
MTFSSFLDFNQLLVARLSLALLLSLSQIALGLLFLGQRERLAWVALLGGILQFFSVLMYEWVHTLPHYGGATETGIIENLRDEELRFIAEIMKHVGSVLFFFSLLVSTIRRRALTTRIAELEQVIAAQNSRLQQS